MKSQVRSTALRKPGQMLDKTMNQEISKNLPNPDPNIQCICSCNNAKDGYFKKLEDNIIIPQYIENKSWWSTIKPFITRRPKKSSTSNLMTM